MNYLFVYGTLMSPFSFSASKHLRDCSDFVSKGYINGRLYLVQAEFDYPALKIGEVTKVFGELYRITDSNVFDFLDEFEGSEYGKIDIEVTIENEQKIVAQCYHFLGLTDQFKVISSGDFLQMD